MLVAEKGEFCGEFRLERDWQVEGSAGMVMEYRRSDHLVPRGTRGRATDSMPHLQERSDSKGPSASLVGKLLQRLEPGNPWRPLGVENNDTPTYPSDFRSELHPLAN